MIIKRKLFSFLSWLTGSNEKAVRKSSKEVIDEFKRQTTINNDAILELKKHIPSGLNLPNELKLYLSFVYENYKDTPITLVDKHGKEYKTMLSFDGIIKRIKRYRRTFNTNKNNTLIFLVSDNDKKSYGTEYYYCYFPKADGIWLFEVQWGNMSQGLFGIASRDGKFSSTLELMLM